METERETKAREGSEKGEGQRQRLAGTHRQADRHVGRETHRCPKHIYM